MRRCRRLAHLGAQGRQRRAARLGRRDRAGPPAGPGRRDVGTRSPRRLKRPMVSHDPPRLGVLRGGGRVARPEMRVVDGERLLATRRDRQRQKRRDDAYTPPEEPGFEHWPSPKQRAEGELPHRTVSSSPQCAMTIKYLTSVHYSYRDSHIMPRSLMDPPVAAVPGRPSESEGYAPVCRSFSRVRGPRIDNIGFENGTLPTFGFQNPTEDGAAALRSLTTGPVSRSS